MSRRLPGRIAGPPLILAIGLLLTAAVGGPISVATAQHGQGHEGQGRHRNPSDLKAYLEHLDRAERDKDQKPSQVIKALALRPGMAVADLGSGSGYFTRRFVEAVTETGKVYAIDVEPEMLAYVKDSLVHLHVPYSAEFVLARPDDPKLPAESVDLVFLCNVYHHLDRRPAYFANVKAALRKGGRVAILDFYHDERSGDVGFPKQHLVPRETVVREMGQAGYRLVREHAFLPRQYFLEFELLP
ncbi:MAG: class I SAM-dependent methyltransferase [Nitrospirota bacterium]